MLCVSKNKSLCTATANTNFITGLLLLCILQAKRIKKSKKMTSLAVAVRVRPLSDREISTKAVSIVSVQNGKTIAVTNIKVPEQNAGDSRERVRRFNFDYCFDCAATQEDVFENISGEIVKSLQKRFHMCILTYGQSASGKTFTMIGGKDRQQDAGLLTRICENIFNFIEDCAIGSEVGNLKTTVSYLEIYNEKVRDLLNLLDPRENVALKVREHPKNGPYVQGLSERIVFNAETLLDALNFGNANRTVGTTNSNPCSSRSHSVFTITCLSGLKLRFIDLAGSERAGGSEHCASRFREGSNINKSLVALRNVISALAEWSKHPKVRKRFVPYRDSILTWLLKDTLGGTSRSVLISTISPSSTCYNETVNTLRFGQRAKQIVVQPLVNEDPKETTIRELRAEIAKLKEILLQAQFPHSRISNRLICSKGNQKVNESVDSDSGLSETENPSLSSESCDSDADVNQKPVEKSLVNVEELIPVMDVVTKTSEKSMSADLGKNLDLPIHSDLPNLDSKLQNLSLPTDSQIPSKNSEEPNSSAPVSSEVSSRKRSMDKQPKVPLLKKADSKLKIEPKAKVDSHRNKAALGNARSHVVAAVTQRLYNKVKRREASTDTLDLNSPTRDLSITSKARLRLQELTHKALSAHRRRNAETQTSLFPVLRIKEASTDVSDLKLATEQVANVETGTDALEFNDVSTNCSFLETLVNFDKNGNDSGNTRSLVFTRTCSTSTENLNKCEKIENPPISFTKYLLANEDVFRMSVGNAAVSSPIYASSVSINVNHNYNSNHNCCNNASNKVNDNVSDDSLDTSNVCFHTPDLISNHNSLEPPHAQTTSNAPTNINAPTNKISALRFASSNSLEDFENQLTPTQISNRNFCVANVHTCNQNARNRVKINFETQYVSQTCTTDTDEDFELFYKAPPKKYRPRLCSDLEEPILTAREPLILKSIMKSDSDGESSSASSINLFEDVPDSMSYYLERTKKRVRFQSSYQDHHYHHHDHYHHHHDNYYENRYSQNLGRSESEKANQKKCTTNDQVFTALTSWMQEVRTLITDFIEVAQSLDHEREQQLNEQAYDCEITIHNYQDFDPPMKRLPKTYSDFTHQTSPKRTRDVGVNVGEEYFKAMPVNMYQSLLELSCDRLERTIKRSMSEKLELHTFPQPFTVAPSCTTYPSGRALLGEDSSLESQRSFSDYGSLPRKAVGGAESRMPFRSPRNYLRELTKMRKDIVKNSREELISQARMHL